MSKKSICRPKSSVFVMRCPLPRSRPTDPKIRIIRFSSSKDSSTAALQQDTVTPRCICILCICMRSCHQAPCKKARATPAGAIHPTSGCQRHRRRPPRVRCRRSHLRMRHVRRLQIQPCCPRMAHPREPLLHPLPFAALPLPDHMISMCTLRERSSLERRPCLKTKWTPISNQQLCPISQL